MQQANATDVIPQMKAISLLVLWLWSELAVV